MRFRRHQEAATAATRQLLLAFAAVLLVVVAAVNALLWAAWRLTLPWASELPALFFETNTALVLLFVLGGCWVESLRLREGGIHVARLAGARPAEADGGSSSARLERRLVRVVQEMALAARVPPPAAWVMPRDDRINAFAAGWSPADAVVAVTRGALERLTRPELQAVVAHEMGHLVRGDARLNMRVLGLVWGLQMVHGFGRELMAADEQGRRHAGVLFGLALVAVGWLGWLGGRLLQAGVSRQREFLADASAVQYTRQVDGLGGALRKIAGHVPAPSPAPPACLAHLWLAAPALPAGWRLWLATHPPLADRLQRLYGRRVEALAAPLEPEPSAEEDAEALPPAFAARKAQSPDSARPAASPVAWVQPAAAGAASDGGSRVDADAVDQADRDRKQEREREALQRSQYWAGEGERHAALLALLVGSDPADPLWSAWQRATTACRSADAVRRDVLTLGPAARVLTLQRLSEATAAEIDRHAARRKALALVRAAGDDAGPQGLRWLRLLLLRRLLGRRPRGRAAKRPLSALSDALALTTAWLAPLWAPADGAVVDGSRTSTPADAAGRPRRGRSAPTELADWPSAAAPGATRSALRRALALRRLHPMQRPLLVKYWLHQATREDARMQATGAEALALICRGLDTPEPAAVTEALRTLP